ncbi:MAG: hypothetical protein JNL65_03775 [Saprospiraceae bacterium]|nr:hypothetical protein [Saprospiraceae bacterium]HRG68224.1 hypothetical protein [Saprospiraceae bacterium]
MFEHKSNAVAHSSIFYRRLLKFWILGTLLITISLIMGTLGYMYFGDLNWIDGLYNASMILTGMGPAVENPCDSLKLFASFYAMYSGIIFLSSVTIVFAPIIHRFFHIIHVEGKN